MNTKTTTEKRGGQHGGAILKIIGGLMLIGVIGVVGVGYYVYVNKNEIVRSAVERVSEYLFDVDVAIAGANLDIGAQEVSFQEYKIANPPGYKSSHAIAFGSILTKADVQSFRTDVPVVNLIELKSPEFIYERTLKTSNINDLIKNVSRFSSEAETAPTTKAEEDAQIAIRIDKVVIEKASVNVTVPMTGGQTLGITLGRIELNALGGGEPIFPAKAALIILRAVLEAVVNSNELTAKLGDAAGQVKALLEGEIAGISGAILKMPNAAVDTLKKGLDTTLEGAGQAVDKGAEAVQAVSDGLQAAAADVTAGSKKAADSLTSKTAEISTSVSESVDQGVEKVKEGFQDARESAGEAVDEAKNKVKNLLGGVKKTEEKTEE